MSRGRKGFVVSVVCAVIQYTNATYHKITKAVSAPAAKSDDQDFANLTDGRSNRSTIYSVLI